MSSKNKSNLKVMVLLDERLIPPKRLNGYSSKQIERFRVEYDVVTSLKKAKYDVYIVGLGDSINIISEQIGKIKPDIIFNLMEEFNGKAEYDQNIVSYLELLNQSYTGCNPRGLMLAHDKALSKKILISEGIKIPEFQVYNLGEKVINQKFNYPFIVKSLIEEGSVGLSQDSIVHNFQSLKKRISYMHKKFSTPVIVEQYISGRELYVGILGNSALTVLPVWELTFKNNRNNFYNIASDRAKWSNKYQKRVGLDTKAAKNLTKKQLSEINYISCKVYRALNLSGYARLDFRLSNEGELYFIEANPNPNIRKDEDFARAATYLGIDYQKLLKKIIQLGIN